MNNSELVFSTKISKQEIKYKKKARDKAPIVFGPCKMRLEKKGRGGKQVTIIHNISFSKMQAKGLMRELQGRLACGASYKDCEILINGDHRDAVEKFFIEKNIKIVRSGG